MDNIRQKLLVKTAGKYSSTIENFHQRQINELVYEEQTAFCFLFEDLMDFDEEHQFMKRSYKNGEYIKKMQMFGQYYSLHRDKPRIVNKDLEFPYQKWHYKHRKLIFKQVCSNSKTNVESSEQDSLINNFTTVTHFLLNISTYNPYSKNYYLRKQLKLKEKTHQKKKQKDRDGNSVLSFLGKIIDENSYVQKLSEISFQKNKHNRYYSVDEIFSGKKSQKVIKTTKKPIKINLFPRKSQNALQYKQGTKSVKILSLRGNKMTDDKPEQRTSDRIVKNFSTTKLCGSTQTFRIIQKKKTAKIQHKAKAPSEQFSDKRFQTTKMPMIKSKSPYLEKIQRIQRMQRNQKMNKLLSIKLKC